MKAATGYGEDFRHPGYEAIHVAGFTSGSSFTSSGISFKGRSHSSLPFKRNSGPAIYFGLLSWPAHNPLEPSSAGLFLVSTYIH